eukprot:g16513.t1
MHGLMLDEHKEQMVVTLGPMAENDLAKQKGKKKEEMPHLDVDDMDPAQEEDHRTGFSEDDEAEDAPNCKPKSTFLGHARQMIQVLKGIDDETLSINRTVPEMHRKFCRMLETLTTRSDDDTKMFESPTVRLAAQCFLDDDTDENTALSLMQIKTKLSHSRALVWQIMISSMMGAIHLGKHHRAAAFSRMEKVLNCYFFEVYDPQFGLWESLVRETIAHDDGDLASMMDAWPFKMQVFGKLAAKTWILEEDHDRVRTQVGHCIDSDPAWEKENETCWKMPQNQKKHATADHSLWRKQCDRYSRSQLHMRYKQHKPLGRENKFTELPFQTVKEIAIEAIMDECLDFESVRVALSNELKSMEENAGATTTNGAYLTERFNEIKAELEDKVGEYECKRHLKQCRALCKALGDEKCTSFAPDNIGARGATAKALLDSPCCPERYAFLYGTGLFVSCKFDLRAAFEKEHFIVTRKKGEDFKIACNFKCNCSVLQGVSMLADDVQTKLRHSLPVEPEAVTANATFLAEQDRREGDVWLEFENHVPVIVMCPEGRWISATEMQLKYFAHCPASQRLAMLKPYEEQRPLLDATFFSRCTYETQFAAFRYLLDGNTFDVNRVGVVIGILQKKRKEKLLQDPAEVEEERLREYIEKQAKQAAMLKAERAEKIDGPHNVEATNLTRERSQSVFLVWDIRTSPPTLVCEFRSHRVKQGICADVYRLKWPDGYKAPKGLQCPECTAEGDPESNVEKLLLVRVLRHKNLERKDVSLVHQVEKIDDYLDVFGDTFKVGLKPLPEPEFESDLFDLEESSKRIGGSPGLFEPKKGKKDT